MFDELVVSGNRLLASLSPDDMGYLRPYFQNVSFEVGRILNEPGDEVERIYFPHTGMTSQLAILLNGKGIETATIGREGAVGTMAGLGLHITLTQAIIQVSTTGSQIHVIPFRRAVEASSALREMIVRYNDVLLGQVQVTAACNALHSLEARLARWILQTRERVDSDIVPLTHQLLSEMLGVRRSSVTRTALKVQAAGFISYRRGTIEIIDRSGLQSLACECYQTLVRQAKILS